MILHAKETRTKQAACIKGTEAVFKVYNMRREREADRAHACTTAARAAMPVNKTLVASATSWGTEANIEVGGPSVLLLQGGDLSVSLHLCPPA